VARHGTLATGGKKVSRRIAILVAVMGLMVMAFAGVALAATINGTAGPDTLIGTREDDVLRGFAGADTINGRGDKDTVFGGRGADTIRARDGERDTIDCGAGVDTVFADPDNEDTIAANCEVVNK
jgi:Ca2+-binding RTX toxin-like protein